MTMMGPAPGGPPDAYDQLAGEVADLSEVPT